MEKERYREFYKNNQTEYREPEYSETYREIPRKKKTSSIVLSIISVSLSLVSCTISLMSIAVSGNSGKTEIITQEVDKDYINSLVESYVQSSLVENNINNAKTEHSIEQEPEKINAQEEFGNSIEEPQFEDKKESEEVNSEKYISITSTELIDAYEENQVKCKQDYDGKLMRVTGKVSSLGTDIMGDTYVCLGHDTEFTFVGIQCYAKDNDVINEIASLKEGDVITVIGKGDCGSMSFSLKKAEIVK